MIFRNGQVIFDRRHAQFNLIHLIVEFSVVQLDILKHGQVPGKALLISVNFLEMLIAILKLLIMVLKLYQVFVLFILMRNFQTRPG